MTKRLAVAVFAALLIVPASSSWVGVAPAQERMPPHPLPPPPPPAQSAPLPPAPPAPPAPPQTPQTPQAGGPNIQLDIVITDTQTGKPVRKSLTMLLRSGSRSAIRSTGSVSVLTPSSDGTKNTVNFQGVSLNLDAGADWLGNEMIGVMATLQFTPASGAKAPEQMESAFAPNLSQTIDVTVRSGRAVLVSRSADPITDRTVTVELTATIQGP